jgi:hypothetical protein
MPAECHLQKDTSQAAWSAHWLTDVLGGYALGAAWLALVVAIENTPPLRSQTHPAKRQDPTVVITHTTRATSA